MVLTKAEKHIIKSYNCIDCGMTLLDRDERIQCDFCKEYLDLNKSFICVEDDNPYTTKLNSHYHKECFKKIKTK